jgi:F-type H+-transporting ATPase subunit alpha
METLKQPQYIPMPVAEQVATLFVAVSGYLDDLPVEAVPSFEARFLSFLREQRPEILDGLRRERRLTDELRAALESTAKAFKGSFRP